MTQDPTSSGGVEAQPGTGGEGGVPTGEQQPTQQAPVEGQPPAQPTVPSQPPTAPATAPRVNLDELEDFKRWKSEYDRRFYQQEQEKAEWQRRAQEAQMRAETADMSDEDRYKYMFEKQQEQIAQLRQEQAERDALEAWRWEIAQQTGVNPASLDTRYGVQGMFRQAMGQIDRGQAQPTTPTWPPMPTQQVPGQQPTQPTQPTQEPPKAPGAPTSSAPTSDFQEWQSTGDFFERQKKLPKGRAFEEWMRAQGEEE